jgi:hypothetical protein
MATQLGEQKFAGGQTVIVERVGADGHRYKVWDDPDLAAGAVVTSVTKVLSATFAKPALAGWASGIRRDSYDQAIAESVLNGEVQGFRSAIATIVGRADDIHKVKRTEAADWGKAVHAAVENAIHGISDGAPEHERIAIGVMAWLKAMGITELHSEVIVYDPFSKVAGTADLVAKTRAGGTYFADYKATGGFYPEMAVQLGAYAQAFRFNCPIGMEGLAINGYDGALGEILKLPKETPNPGEPLVMAQQVDLWNSADVFTAAANLADIAKGPKLWAVVVAPPEEAEEEQE